MVIGIKIWVMENLLVMYLAHAFQSTRSPISDFVTSLSERVNETVSQRPATTTFILRHYFVLYLRPQI